MALRTDEGVDAVFHFAANPEVRMSTTNSEMHFNENVVATFSLLEAMRRKDLKNLYSPHRALSTENRRRYR